MVTPVDEWLYTLVLVGALASLFVRPRVQWHGRLSGYLSPARCWSAWWPTPRCATACRWYRCWRSWRPGRCGGWRSWPSAGGAGRPGGHAGRRGLSRRERRTAAAGAPAPVRPWDRLLGWLRRHARACHWADLAAPMVLALVAWLYTGRLGASRLLSDDEGSYFYAIWRISLGERPYCDFLTPQLPGLPAAGRAAVPPGGPGLRGRAPVRGSGDPGRGGGAVVRHTPAVRAGGGPGGGDAAGAAPGRLPGRPGLPGGPADAVPGRAGRGPVRPRCLPAARRGRAAAPALVGGGLPGLRVGHAHQAVRPDACPRLPAVVGAGCLAPPPPARGGGGRRPGPGAAGGGGGGPGAGLVRGPGL